MRVSAVASRFFQMEWFSTIPSLYRVGICLPVWVSPAFCVPGTTANEHVRPRGKRIYFTYVNETEKWFLIGGDWGEVGTEVWWTKGVEERRAHSLFQRQMKNRSGEKRNGRERRHKRDNMQERRPNISKQRKHS